MLHQRIVVGVDGSAAARHALDWAIHEALRRRCGVLVVTAWPAWARDAARGAGTLPAERRRLQRMQEDFVAATTALLPQAPPVVCKLVLGDPLPALTHAGRRAELLVLGGAGTPDGTSLAQRVTRRLRTSRYGVPAPPVVVLAALTPSRPGTARTIRVPASTRHQLVAA